MPNIFKSIVYLLVSAIFTLVFAQPSSKPETYTVGITPQFESRKLFEIWRPILDSIEADTGIRLTIRGAPTTSEFEQQYSEGAFDFAYVNPYMVGVKNPKGYIPLVRDHGTKLVGILVIRKDSGINSVKELEGKTVAFPAPDALAAYLLVMDKLESEFGIHVTPKFVRSHDSTFLNAATGLTAAAGGVRGTFERQPEDVRNLLKEIIATKGVAPIPFVANPRVPEHVRESVRNAFIKLNASSQGKLLLSKIPIKEIGVASMADYEPLRKMGLEKYVSH